MKHPKSIVGAVGLAVAVSGWIAWAQIQTVGEIVTTARQEAALSPVAEKTIPLFTLTPATPPGTYWMLQTDTPPLPFNPFPELTVYPLGDGAVGAVYLVDDRSVDYPGLWAWQAMEAQAQRLLESSTWDGMTLMSLEGGGPPFPGEGGTNDPPVSDPPLGGPSYGTNDLWLEILAVTNQAGFLRIHTPESDGVYDLFRTTNLSPHVAGLNLTHWQWLWRTAVGQTNLTVTNLVAGESYFVLGLTNDSDGGGWSDAFERLVSHTDPDDPDDDRLTPWVGIVAVDSVALEQYPTNTATLRVTRLGGFISEPFAVSGSLSGTATPGVDYTLSGAGVTGTNVTVQFASGQTSVEITLTAQSDTDLEGTETATLTLATNAGWDVDPARASATAWIVEEYSKTYTTVADFNQGVRDGLESFAITDDGHLRFKTNLPAQFPFINVACSDRGTVARINTTNGMVAGEYRTAPAGLPNVADPSRTTVDQFGNVWVANRADQMQIQGVSHGSITRIGLIIGGTRFVKDGTNYTENPLGQYVKLDTCDYNTCSDRDGDGYIRTSRGLADILPWNNGGGVDSHGGVSTAEDEAITEYVRVPLTGTRSIAVDKHNDLWVGGRNASQTHVKVSGLLGLPVPDSVFHPYAGGYGAVVDRLGNFWSAAVADAAVGNNHLLRLIPPPLTNFPPQEGVDWQDLSALHGVDSGYGIAVDPLHPYIWQTTRGNSVFRWYADGTPVTNASGAVILHYHGFGDSQGLAVAADGHVWVAHEQHNGSTVGHLNTNGTLVGVVSLSNYGLWGEYFDNPNLTSEPVLAALEQAALNFTWTNGWPDSPVPPNQFSARWTGVVSPTAAGQHVFHVHADAGAAVRLTVNGAVIIDNWTAPGTNAVALSGTNWLGTNVACDLTLEYSHLVGGPWLSLSWTPPGATNREVIPADRFQASSHGPTGISIDAAGKIWAGCWHSSTAVRINPNAGPRVVWDGVTNHVGWVDMVVQLGDGSWHTSPYDKPASPYNYSDMTGFNVRVVNPGLQPLAGYWKVVEDSRNAGQLWNKVSWTAAITNGCSVEVHVRAADERTDLGSAVFVPVTNAVFFPAIRGRYLEVRVGITRDDASKEPVLYDLTIYGTSSGFTGDFYLYDAWADEGSDGAFWTDLVGAEPMGYQWYRLYPWETNWVEVAGATNSYFVVTNVDSWVDWTMTACFVTNGAGESLWLGPAYLVMFPAEMRLPAINYPSGQGPATQYPATINVFGQPTNLNSVVVTVWGLSHTRSADLNLLLQSPSGKRIILMSNVGGTNGVSNASIAFKQSGPLPNQAAPILPPNEYYVLYQPSNYGQKTPQSPFGLPAGPYSSNLLDLQGDDPNGVWKLYIYDDVQPGGTGQLLGSWTLDFTFQ